MLALGATLLTAFAPAPALAQDTGAIIGSVSAGGVALTPPPNPTDTTAAANGEAASTPSQTNTATNTQTTTTTGGDGGAATGGNAGPSQSGGSSRAGSHGGTAYANGGDTKSYTRLESTQSNRVSHGTGSAHGAKRWENPGAEDSIVVDTTRQRHSKRAAAPMREPRLRTSVEPVTAGRAGRLEARARFAHETAKASSLAGALRGHGGRLPGQNPFLSLLNGSGGAGAGLLLMTLLAVLTASRALPIERFRALRTSTATWRPTAYVPPIELPG